MSAFGTKRTCRVALHMSAFGGKSGRRLDITERRLIECIDGICQQDDFGRPSPLVRWRAAAGTDQWIAGAIESAGSGRHRLKCYPTDYPERHFMV